MPYSVNEVIVSAFYLSRVRSADFQQVGGDDITTGLRLFNDVIAEQTANKRMLPYYSEYASTFVIGQEKYFIPKLVEPLSLTFNQGVIRFSTNDLTRRQYHSTDRIDGIKSYPFDASIELCLGGADLYVQYLPIQAFPFKIWGKFSFKDDYTPTDLTFDLLTIHDRFYINYLKHLLCMEICKYYATDISADVRETYNRLAGNINDFNVYDLTPKKINTYSDGIYPISKQDWISANLFRGYVP